MARTSEKREKLLNAANLLIYQQGFSQTSLADIAQESGVPLGNVYYYFKTKNDLVEAVIEERKQQLLMNFKTWDAIPEPRERLLSLLKMLQKTRQDVAKYGCPIGGLCMELNKEQSMIAPFADDMLKIILKWVTQQFSEMRCNKPQDFGVKFMVALQGASAMANALHKPKIISQQYDELRKWITSIQ